MAARGLEASLPEPQRDVQVEAKAVWGAEAHTVAGADMAIKPVPAQAIDGGNLEQQRARSQSERTDRGAKLEAVSRDIRQQPGPAERGEEARLEDLLCAKTVELQTLRAQGARELYQARQEIDELGKELASKTTDAVRLRAMLRQCLHENAQAENEYLEKLRQIERTYQAEFEELRSRALQLQAESEVLHETLRTSWALKLARSAKWLLEPVRRWFA